LEFLVKRGLGSLGDRRPSRFHPGVGISASSTMSSVTTPKST
jgi:hypothetical protein